MAATLADGPMEHAVENGHTMPVKLAGKCVLITGAADGIGAATARALVAAGAFVVLVDIQREKLQALEGALAPEALAVAADVTDTAALASAVAAGVERHGGIDVVVAGAGIDAIVPVGELEDATFTRIIEVNLLGTWRTVHATLPELRRRRGYLLVISSGSAVVQGPYEAAYNASKAGIAAFANTLRLEERRHGVSVGVAYFGLVATEHGLRSVNHPLMRDVFARAPRLLRDAALQAAPVDAAAAALVRGIERRARRVVFPANQRLSVALASLPQALLERIVRLG
jgi:NAD(P)-dependent dehydrogenase (short-subunit alcohol dehydrogenase family)